MARAFVKHAQNVLVGENVFRTFFCACLVIRNYERNKNALGNLAAHRASIRRGTIAWCNFRALVFRLELSWGRDH